MIRKLPRCETEIGNLTAIALFIAIFVVSIGITVGLLILFVTSAGAVLGWMVGVVAAAFNHGFHLFF